VTWLEEEQSLVSVALGQAWRIGGRARRRPWVTLGLTLVLAGIFVAVQARRPKMYTAEVGLLITEGVLKSDGHPRPHGELRAVIDDAIFVTARFEEMVDKHDLVKKLGLSSKAVAVAKVKKLIEVEVWQDYFDSYRRSTDPPRSAHVTIGFSAPDPETALAVARDLGELLAAAQIARESDAAAARVAGLRAIAESAAARAVRQNERARRERENLVTRPGERLAPAPEQISFATRAADQTARAAAVELFDAQLQIREIRNPGRLVQVVDPGISLWQKVPLRARLVRQAEVSLVLALFLAVVLVGALDPTVRDEQDLRRVGLQPIGSIPVCNDPPPSGEV
jgi:hypothetical protein